VANHSKLEELADPTSFQMATGTELLICDLAFPLIPITMLLEKTSLFTIALVRTKASA